MHMYNDMYEISKYNVLRRWSALYFTTVITPKKKEK